MRTNGLTMAQAPMSSLPVFGTMMHCRPLITSLALLVLHAAEAQITWGTKAAADQPPDLSTRPH
jgi:hypothetical protein